MATFSPMSNNQTTTEQILTKQCEAAARMSSRLFANVSHDLGTPAAAVRGYIRLVLNGRAGPLTEQQREYLAVALESANQLCNIALRVSKVPDFIDQLEAETFDIRAEWEKVARSRKSLILQKSIPLRQPALVDPLFVVGDRKYLQKALGSILDVSINRAPQGSEIFAEFSHAGDQKVTLRICSPGNCFLTSADLEASRNILFLHGGALSLETDATGFACIISLPKAGERQ